MAHDLLVALLNLDAEIKYRMARLAQLDCNTDEPVTPWREDARADLIDGFGCNRDPACSPGERAADHKQPTQRSLRPQ